VDLRHVEQRVDELAHSPGGRLAPGRLPAQGRVVGLLPLHALAQET